MLLIGYLSVITFSSFILFVYTLTYLKNSLQKMKRAQEEKMQELELKKEHVSTTKILFTRINSELRSDL